MLTRAVKLSHRAIPMDRDSMLGCPRCLLLPTKFELAPGVTGQPDINVPLLSSVGLRRQYYDFSRTAVRKAHSCSLDHPLAQ